MCYFLVLEGMIHELIHTVESNQFDALIKCIEVYKESDVPARKYLHYKIKFNADRFRGNLLFLRKLAWVACSYTLITILTIAFF